MCDGFAQCPYSDDELTCDFKVIFDSKMSNDHRISNESIRSLLPKCVHVAKIVILSSTSMFIEMELQHVCY